MKATQLLHNLGQSIWLDNITRDLLTNGTLKHYVDETESTCFIPKMSIQCNPQLACQRKERSLR